MSKTPYPSFLAEFKRIIHDRNINHLIHFTDVCNLGSILSNGILTRDTLEKHQTIHGFVGDPYRFDKNLDATCCSIEDPNIELLNKRVHVEKLEQLVLVLSTDVILDKYCAFYQRNAAKKQYRYISVNSLCSPEKLEGLFSEVIDGVKHDRSNLCANQTTDITAEVHVFSVIEPDYIEEIIVRSNQLAEKLKRHHPIWAEKIFVYWDW